MLIEKATEKSRKNPVWYTTTLDSGWCGIDQWMRSMDLPARLGDPMGWAGFSFSIPKNPAQSFVHDTFNRFENRM